MQKLDELTEELRTLRRELDQRSSTDRADSSPD